MPDTGTRRRSHLVSATYTAIALVFFFGVGLAGGAVYKIYFGDNAGPRVADQISPPPSRSGPPPVPAENFAADAASAAAAAAPDLAEIEPSAAPTLAPPAAPTQAEATRPQMPAVTVAQAAPPAPEPAPQAAPAEPLAPVPVPYAEPTPAQPALQPETQAAAPQRIAASPPKKPADSTTTTKAHRTAPAQAAALPAPGRVAAGAFRVQFGAFAHEDNARRVQSEIEATGLKVEVGQEAGASGQPLFIVHSPSYADRAAAVSAAQTVQTRAQHLVNPVRIDYTIIPERAAGEQHAQR